MCLINGLVVLLNVDTYKEINMYLTYWLSVEDCNTDEDLAAIDFGDTGVIVLYNASDVDKMQQALWYLSKNKCAKVIAVWHPEALEAWTLYSIDPEYPEQTAIENMCFLDDMCGVNIVFIDGKWEERN